MSKLLISRDNYSCNSVHDIGYQTRHILIYYGVSKQVSQGYPIQIAKFYVNHADLVALFAY